MNDQLDELLQQALAPSGRYNTQKAESVRREVTAMYDNQLKMWRYIIWALLAVDTFIMLAAVTGFLLSSDIKILIGCAVMFLWAFSSTILMKLWYWQMNTKYAVLKELAELRLQIAQLSDGEPKGEGA